MDHSYPKSPATAAEPSESNPETPDRVSRSRRNRETNPVEYLYFPDDPGEPYPTCTIRAESFPDRSHHGCTAIAFLRASECCGGEPPDFLLWARPSISGSDPRHHQALLHRRFRSVKRSQ